MIKENILQLNEITKGFQGTDVLKHVSLNVREGDFVTILGPSGCGKTTLLRIIAGLESPDSGSVCLEGRDVTMLEPNLRNVNMVFQNYALFPHMNVESNVGYGLKIKKLSKSAIAEKVQNVLKLVQLEEYGKRMPSELSGGQRQRVAIARALVNEPKILLLDEPLGALDLQLRRQMQIELKKLQKMLGITFVYITHDQEEAINMSDVIVVMKSGVIEQEGSPNEIYYNPKNAYVASFVGGANVISGICERNDDSICIKVGNNIMPVKKNNMDYSDGDEIQVAVRTESIVVSDEASGIPAIVRKKSFVGGLLRMSLELEDGQLIEVSSHGIDSEYSESDRVFIAWGTDKAVLLEKESKNEKEQV